MSHPKPESDIRLEPTDSTWDLIDQAIQAIQACPLDDWPADLERLVSDQNPVAKRQVLLELITVDFERGWRADDSRTAMVYIEAREWLQQDPEAIAKLATWEFELRRDAGQSIDHGPWVSRFPDVAPYLGSWSAAHDQTGLDIGFSVAVSVPQLEAITRGLSDESDQESARALPCGHMLGRYRIAGVLGRGGMGIVYLCEDLELKRLVAVKVLHSWILDPTWEHSLLKQEARTAAQIPHESIVPIYDFGEADDGSQFFVMEYIDGQSLDEYLKENEPLPISRAVEIVAEIADALQVAHASGFVHRDIKPGNILIDQRGRARLTDFGLAKRRHQQGYGVRSGTIPYMAPEQFEESTEDEVLAADVASDIWALGVVLYELLTGRRPFEGEKLSEITHSIQRDTPPGPRSLRPDVPAVVDRLCQDCLSKDPSRRPSTATSLAKALREGLAASDASGWWNRRSVLGLAGLVAAVTLAVVWGPWNTGRTSDAGNTPAEASHSMIGDANRLIPVEDGICPWLRSNCKLVLSMDTGRPFGQFEQLEQTDREQLYAQLEQEIRHQKELTKYWQISVLPQVRETRENVPGWMAWTMDVVPMYDRRSKRRGSESLNFNRAISYLAPSESLGLKLRFAVHPDGRIQVGTSGVAGEDQFQLLLLGYGNTLNLCNYRTADGKWVKRSDIERPLDGDIQFGVRSTCLADIAVVVYRVLFRLESSYDTDVQMASPQEIYGFDFELKNYFDRPVTLVDQRLTFMLFRDRAGLLGIKENVELIDTAIDSIQATNRSALPIEPRSAIDGGADMAFFARNFNKGDPSKGTWECPPDDDRREFVYHRVVTGFQLPKAERSVLLMRVESDNRNCSRIRVHGLDPILRRDKPDNGQRGSVEEWQSRRTKGPSPDDISRSEIRIDRQARQLTISEWNLSGASAVLFNRRFERIDIEAIQQWSSLRPSVRYVFLGEWRDEMVTRSEAIAEVHKAKPYDPTKKQHQQLSGEWDLLQQPVAMTEGPDPRPKKYGPIPFAPRTFTIPPSPRFTTAQTSPNDAQ